MKPLSAIFAVLLVASAVADVKALDAPPPPELKTLKWTIELASKNIPILRTKETPISALLGSLASTMSMPGFYLDIDFTEVKDRTGKKVNLEVKDITWLATVAMVADMIDSDIQIRPGVIKLVPRDQDDSSLAID